jgi:hypothetical protein
MIVMVRSAPTAKPTNSIGAVDCKTDTLRKSAKITMLKIWKDPVSNTTRVSQVVVIQEAMT